MEQVTADDQIEVQTHAWFEARLPDAWMSLDPTNGQQASELHVEIGHGRDYADVTPIHGVHLGAAEVQLESSVSMRRGPSAVPPVSDRRWYRARPSRPACSARRARRARSPTSSEAAYSQSKGGRRPKSSAIPACQVWRSFAR